MAEERTTEEERNHILEARKRVANKRRKMKLTGKSRSMETDEDDDEPDEGKFFLVEIFVVTNFLYNMESNHEHLQKPTCPTREKDLVTFIKNVSLFSMF